MSKAASAAITVTVRQTPISCLRSGMVILTNSVNQVAPSILRRLIERWVDLGHRRQQQDGAESQQNPDPDQANRRECPIKVAQPGTGECTKANSLEDLIDQARKSQTASPR